MVGDREEGKGVKDVICDNTKCCKIYAVPFSHLKEIFTFVVFLQYVILWNTLLKMYN